MAKKVTEKVQEEGVEKQYEEATQKRLQIIEITRERMKDIKMDILVAHALDRKKGWNGIEQLEHEMNRLERSLVNFQGYKLASEQDLKPGMPYVGLNGEVWWREWKPEDLEGQERVTFVPLPITSPVPNFVDTDGLPYIKQDINGLVCWMVVGKVNTVYKMFYDNYMDAVKAQQELDKLKNNGPQWAAWAKNNHGRNPWHKTEALTFGMDMDGRFITPDHELVEVEGDLNVTYVEARQQPEKVTHHVTGSIYMTKEQAEAYRQSKLKPVEAVVTTEEQAELIHEVETLTALQEEPTLRERIFQLLRGQFKNG